MAAGQKKNAETIEISTLVRPARFELATLGLEDRCSIQVSYGRITGKNIQFRL